MCGRYTVNTEDEIMEMRDIIQEISIRIMNEAEFDYGKEAYPSCIAPVITPNKQLSLAKWGFEKWDKKGVIFNARSETIETNKVFSHYLNNGRCIIPASSYYEWIRLNNKPIEKYRIFSEEGKPIFMAGIIKNNINLNKQEYVIITRKAADNISFIHHRMPLILSAEQALLWMSGDFDKRLLDIINNLGFEKVG